MVTEIKSATLVQALFDTDGTRQVDAYSDGEYGICLLDGGPEWFVTEVNPNAENRLWLCADEEDAREVYANLLDSAAAAEEQHECFNEWRAQELELMREESAA